MKEFCRFLYLSCYPYSMPHSPVGENILYNPDFSKGLDGWDSATLNGFNTLQTNTITGNVLNMKMTPQNAQSPKNRMTLLQFLDTLPLSNYKFSIDVKANKLIPGSESRIQFKQISTTRGQLGLGDGGSIEIKSDDLGKWIHLEGTDNGVTPYQPYNPGLDVTGIEDVDVKNPEIVRLD
ncbi:MULTISPECIES: hypothetical protein [unclassified Enterococcus]|uniref:hypothetical protein n=1 Tax=unclassified Enterococcus TaxID=2608891 RepID=UPI0028FDC466|nr:MULTISPECIES: hypothetical protein [unclassified Enterococcus]MDU0320673.1 hypothetical protein [Enterococcus sp. 2STP]MDU0333958.1 hypothetical protein [Enterococcus sp. 2CBP]MDU0350391.1 hypothetical protein [Enterococcus sp. 3MOLP]